MLTTVDLNGTWDFIADLNPRYHLDPARAAIPEYARSALNRRHWQKVPVPGCWQKYAERYAIFEGVCWFSRWCDLPAYQPGTPARLRFGAVNYACRVFVNDIEIGAHELGYTPFTLDVSRALVRGRNHIAVCVDNRDTGIVWPHVIGYFNYGGIHRGVALELLEGACIADITWDARWTDEGALLRVAGAALNSAGGSVRLVCAGSACEAPVGADGAFEAVLQVPGAGAWSPQAPNLYAAVLTLVNAGEVADERRHACGFKRLEIQGGVPLLNGRPIRLNGLCYVYDSPSSGLAMTPEQVAQDVALMKQAGVNTVRCHYPIDELFYAACDAAGLLVWIEPTVYCYHPADEAQGTLFSDPHAVALAHQMVREMVAAARGHVSVAVYGLGNECNSEHPEAGPFFAGLAAAVRALDSTRLVSYAALYGTVGPVADVVDVLGINSYWGWYDKVLDLAPGEAGPAASSEGAVEPIDLAPMRRMLDRVIASTPANLALLLTEFGADSVPGFYARSRDLWSEDYHAALIAEILALAAEYPRVVGTLPFCFSDYRDPSKDANGYWNELNLKGMVDYARNPKKAFRALQARYTGG